MSTQRAADAETIRVAPHLKEVTAAAGSEMTRLFAFQRKNPIATVILFPRENVESLVPKHLITTLVYSDLTSNP